MGAWRQDGLADSYVGRNVTLTLTFDQKSLSQQSVSDLVSSNT
jgi:hypothetical protein